MRGAHAPGEGAKMFDGKVVLVTGGIGSFGRKFTRAVLDRYQPRKLMILSRDELKQFEMQAGVQ